MPRAALLLLSVMQVLAVSRPYFPDISRAIITPSLAIIQQSKLRSLCVQVNSFGQSVHMIFLADDAYAGQV